MGIELVTDQQIHEIPTYGCLESQVQQYISGECSNRSIKTRKFKHNSITVFLTKCWVPQTLKKIGVARLLLPGHTGNAELLHGVQPLGRSYGSYGSYGVRGPSQSGLESSCFLALSSYPRHLRNCRNWPVKKVLAASRKFNTDLQ